jgi:hypothetical protein
MDLPDGGARTRASRNAMTRNAEASGVDPSLPASTSATNPANRNPRDCATSVSTSQNGGSNATLVRWPAREKLRLIRSLSASLPPHPGP